jgi:hypothetical protein
VSDKPCTSPSRRGFTCPKCGQPFHTSKTVRSAPGVITRYRVCETPACRRRAVVTEERPRPAPPGKRRKHKPASY